MNDNIHETLILIYLNEYEDNYLLSEVKELCNFTNAQLKICINTMKEKNLLESKSDRLLISESGKSLLESKNLLNVSIEDLYKEKVTLNFTEEKLTFEDIYIPKWFKK